MFCPYSDSPELRRVAKAQEVLSDVSSKSLQENLIKIYLPIPKFISGDSQNI